MYYSAQQGVSDTWRDYGQTILQQFRQRNWLPALVGMLMVGWIALIVMGMQQTVLESPTVPDNTKVGTTGQELAVTNTSSVMTDDTTGNSFAVNTNSSNVAMTAPGEASSLVASATPMETVIPDEAPGGRGGETVEDEAPATPVVDPIIDPIIDPLPLPPADPEAPPLIDLEVTLPGAPIDIEVPNPLGGIL